jgi:hypothetical protein
VYQLKKTERSSKKRRVDSGAAGRGDFASNGSQLGITGNVTGINIGHGAMSFGLGGVGHSFAFEPPPTASWAARQGSGGHPAQPPSPAPSPASSLHAGSSVNVNERVAQALDLLTAGKMSAETFEKVVGLLQRAP